MIVKGGLNGRKESCVLKFPLGGLYETLDHVLKAKTFIFDRKVSKFARITKVTN